MESSCFIEENRSSKGRDGTGEKNSGRAVNSAKIERWLDHIVRQWRPRMPDVNRENDFQWHRAIKLLSVPQRKTQYPGIADN